MTAAARPPTARTARCLWLALSLLAATLSWRQIESQDIGYHLAYGERSWQTWVSVDDSSFVYATPESNGKPGPGCWRDDAGNYRFPNANWLAQEVMWVAFRLRGASGITLLAAVLLLAITAVMFRGLRGCGASVPAAGAATLVVLFVMSGRLEPRPELFGYWLLSWQGMTLLAVLHRGGSPQPRTVASLVMSQVLFVNLHSYFLLGLLLSCCYLLPALARAAGR